MKEKVIKGVFYSILFVFVATLAFFIMFNAEWLIGDDAMIIRETGWGHFFSPSVSVTPSAGRFYPLAYFVYNILYVLGLTSCIAHFGLMAIVFCLMSVVALFVARNAIEESSFNAWKYLTMFAVVAIIIQRFYLNYLDAYSTIWFSSFGILTWCMCCYYTHQKQSIVAAVLGFIVITYCCYCIETFFIIPLSYGACGLLFGWKCTTRLEKSYLWALICTALIFLGLYYFICYIHIEEAYDGAHGQNIGLLRNAIKMFIAQKILWLGLIVLMWRTYRIVSKKEEYEFWDTLILSGFAFCCGCAIMKLNWSLYYSSASIFMLPAIVHYINKYLGTKWCAIIMFALALFMCRNIPKQISENQASRKSTTTMMNTISSLHDEGHTFYWFEPSDNREWNFDLEMRRWKRESLQTQIGYQVSQEDFKFQVCQQSDIKPGLYFLPKENDLLFPDINNTIVSHGKVIIGGKDCDIQIVLIE